MLLIHKRDDSELDELIETIFDNSDSRDSDKR
jgi:hypothetical protein